MNNINIPHDLQQRQIDFIKSADARVYRAAIYCLRRAPDLASIIIRLALKAVAANLHAEIVVALLKAGDISRRWPVIGGSLQLCDENGVARLRYFNGRMPKASVVVGRYRAGGWKIESHPIDLHTLFSKIVDPDIGARAYLAAKRSQQPKSRFGSVPTAWR